MEFTEAVSQIAAKVKDLKDGIQTEEATKNAFIMPFIGQVLGYDVFNPNEVIPEFTADVGVKKGEKIDYALVQDGQVQILIECKKVGQPLSLENASQLYRYFACTKARIGVLTNGAGLELLHGHRRAEQDGLQAVPRARPARRSTRPSSRPCRS